MERVHLGKGGVDGGPWQDRDCAQRQRCRRARPCQREAVQPDLRPLGNGAISPQTADSASPIPHFGEATGRQTLKPIPIAT